MGFPWHVFAEIVKRVGPSILVAVNPKLEPVASIVTHAITVAEADPGKTGPAKAAYVQDVVAAAAPLIPGVDVNAINESLQEGIDTVIAVTKIVKPQAAVPLAATSPTASGTVAPGT